MTRVLTIGVYGWDLDSYLAALAAAEVELLLDVRQRRGVRGREYSWANSLRLQQALGQAGISYHHHKELGPHDRAPASAVRRGRAATGR